MPPAWGCAGPPFTRSALIADAARGDCQGEPEDGLGQQPGQRSSQQNAGLGQHERPKTLDAAPGFWKQHQGGKQGAARQPGDENSGGQAEKISRSVQVPSP